MVFKTQRQAKEVIQASIDSNPKAVRKALLMLYERQTYAEQASATTIVHNGEGFSAFDAGILTSFAERLRNGRALTDRQMQIARPKVRRYWKQLAIMSGKLDVKRA